jgi:hypothetical protein
MRPNKAIWESVMVKTQKENTLLFFRVSLWELGIINTSRTVVAYFPAGAENFSATTPYWKAVPPFDH